MNINAKDCNANWVVVSNRELCQKVPASDLYESRVSQVNTALWVRVTLLAAECDSEAKFRRRYKQSAEFTQTHTHDTARSGSRTVLPRLICALLCLFLSATAPDSPGLSAEHAAFVNVSHSLVCIRKAPN